jgi:hypothetical protein
MGNPYCEQKIIVTNDSAPPSVHRPYPDFMSFSSDVNETRSLFGLYAIMVTMVATSVLIHSTSHSHHIRITFASHSW